MNVRVIEAGSRPYVWSKARRFAPAGATVAGEMLGDMTWADEALIVLDWDNSWTGVPSGSEKPILHIIIRKYLPNFTDQNTIDVSARLDVDDVFGGDSMTAETIMDVVHELKEYMEMRIATR